MASENGAATTIDWYLADNQGTVRDCMGAGFCQRRWTSGLADHLVDSAFRRPDQRADVRLAVHDPARFAYAGEMLDWTTGLYYYTARWYDRGRGPF